MENSVSIFVKTICVVLFLYIAALVASALPWPFGLRWNGNPRPSRAAPSNVAVPPTSSTGKMIGAQKLS